MHKITDYIIILLTAVFIVSCGTPEKRYTPPGIKAHSGKAVITEIAEAKNESGSDNRGYVEIYFNFIPSDPGSAENYLCTACSDSNVKLFYDNRESFHSNWVNKWDIKKGNEYPAIRHELSRDNDTARVSYEVFLEPKK